MSAQAARTARTISSVLNGKPRRIVCARDKAPDGITAIEIGSADHRPIEVVKAADSAPVDVGRVDFHASGAIDASYEALVRASAV